MKLVAVVFNIIFDIDEVSLLFLTLVFGMSGQGRARLEEGWAFRCCP